MRPSFRGLLPPPFPLLAFESQTSDRWRIPWAARKLGQTLLGASRRRAIGAHGPPEYFLFPQWGVGG